MDIHTQRILILDFGSQYTQLIARRIREIGAYCEIHPWSMKKEALLQFAPLGIVLSGGPGSVNGLDTIKPDPFIYELGCPLLGICYGMQTMAVTLGGQVERGQKREFGYAKVAVPKTSQLFDSIFDDKTDDGSSTLDVWMSHGDHVSGLPQSFHIIATTNNCPIAGMADDERKFYGLQFHPEVSHTRQGMKILERFVLDICGCKRNWTPKNIIKEQIEKIRKEVGKDGVLLGLSGGVDSSVAAALLHEAIGDQLTCVFVDTGLLRLNEVEYIKNIFGKHLNIKLICVDAEDAFFKGLMHVDDPEKKRKIIGKTFIDVFDKEAEQLENIKWLAQGTIYSDVIESAGTKNGTSHVIKSHHNVGGLPDTMRLKLIEPLRELFKDEVRKIGLELGLPKELVERHPFPGPGLGVRVLGEVKKEHVEKCRLADAILIDELYKQDLYYKVSQAFAVFLPIKSVGVVGDARQYEYVIAIRIVETIDFMTAHWVRLPYDFLETVSRRIINEVPGISRVTYDISSKPPATIEWE